MSEFGKKAVTFLTKQCVSLVVGATAGPIGLAVLGVTESLCCELGIDLPGISEQLKEKLEKELKPHVEKLLGEKAVEQIYGADDKPLAAIFPKALQKALKKVKDQAPYEQWFRTVDRAIEAGAHLRLQRPFSATETGWPLLRNVLQELGNFGSQSLTQSLEMPAGLAEKLETELPALIEAEAYKLLGEEKNKAAFAESLHQEIKATRELIQRQTGSADVVRLFHSWEDKCQARHDEIMGSLRGLHRKVDKLQPNSAVPIWDIPAPTGHFRERPELTRAIEAALAPSQATVALTALNGLGGIGKTQLARHFATSRDKDYKIGVHILADNTASIWSGFASLAGRLGFAELPDQQETAVHAINAICAREPWLVVFDNAESADQLRPFCERLHGKGHVLITSRDPHWDGVAKTVPVTKWPLAQAATFLLDRTGQTDLAAAEALARDLDGLILALEHAAAYMNFGEGASLAGYRMAWAKRLHSAPKHTDYPDSVGASLGLSIDKALATNPVAYEALCVFAWLAPDSIPRKELLLAGARALPEALRKAMEDDERWNELVDTLTSISLLEPLERGYYAIHRVTQQVLRQRQMAEGQADRWRASACDLVGEALSAGCSEFERWDLTELVMPHARAIKESAIEDKQPLSYGRLLNQAGAYLMERGAHKESRGFLESALEAALLKYGEGDSELASCRSNLASVLQILGLPDEALNQIEMALACVTAGDPKVAVYRSNFASILYDLGEHLEACSQIELALGSALPDDPGTAAIRSNFSSILNGLERYDEARKQIELALESSLRLKGPDHPHVSIYRSNLGSILLHFGEIDEARKQIELSLKSDLKEFGSEHTRPALRRLNLALALYTLKDYPRAFEEIEQALEIFLKELPRGHRYLRVAEKRRAEILTAWKQ